MDTRLPTFLCLFRVAVGPICSFHRSEHAQHHQRTLQKLQNTSFPTDQCHLNGFFLHCCRLFPFLVLFICVQCTSIANHNGKMTNQNSCYFYCWFSILGCWWLIVRCFSIDLMDLDVHFQYNGILFGVLVASFAAMEQRQYIMSAIWYSIALNMKHLFLYIAPVYFIYLLRCYCFNGRESFFLVDHF